MATGTQGSTARKSHMQVLHYLRKVVNYNDSGIGSTDTVKMTAKLPAGARIFGTLVNILTAFNAGTTNVLTAGTSAGSDADVVAAADVNEAATGATMVYRGCSLTFASDTDIFVKFTQSGTAASAGQAEIIIAYALNNDG